MTPKFYIYRSQANNLWIAMTGGRDPHHLQFCIVPIRASGPGPKNALVVFDDGWRMVVPRPDKALRPARDRELQTSLF